jgi:hypothetical protein
VTDRAHFYAPILDGEGNIQPNSVVRILQPGTETLIVDPLYSDNTTVSSMSNPFVSVDGTMSFYLDTPQRVRVGITKPGFDEVFFDDIDVLVDATTTLDQTHTGAGTNSMSIGSGSVSGGAGSVALGNSAASAGAEGTAVGHSSNADGGDSTAMGSGAVTTGTGATAAGKGAVGSATSVVAVGKLSAASGNNAVAVGDNAVASSPTATALGSGASSAKTHSTAIGAGAATTEGQQVRLGTTTDYVDVPNFLTLKSIPGGIKYRLYVRDDGTLNLRYHFPLDGVNELTTGSHDDDFEGTNGSWAASAGAITNSTAFAYTGTRSMLMTASGVSAAVTSLKVAGLDGHVYVGKALMYRPSGDTGTQPTQFQAQLLFYDGSNVLIGSAFTGTVQTIVNNTWMPIDVRATAPTGAATVQLKLMVPTGQGASTNHWYVDAAGIFDIPAGT